MAKRRKKMKWYTVAIFGLFGLTVLGFSIATIVYIATNKVDSAQLFNVVPALFTLLVATYFMFIGYKKPNNNIMRYCFLIFAVAFGLLLMQPYFYNLDLVGNGLALAGAIITLLLIISSSVLAFNLKKFNDSLGMIFVIFCLTIALNIITCIDLNNHGLFAIPTLLSVTSLSLSWLCSGIAYGSRYYEYRRLKDIEDNSETK